MGVVSRGPGAGVFSFAALCGSSVIVTDLVPGLDDDADAPPASVRSSPANVLIGCSCAAPCCAVCPSVLWAGVRRITRRLRDRLTGGRFFCGVILEPVQKPAGPFAAAVSLRSRGEGHDAEDRCHYLWKVRCGVCIDLLLLPCRPILSLAAATCTLVTWGEVRRGWITAGLSRRRAA